MAKDKKTVGDFLGSIVGDDGIKSDVNVEITTATVKKVVAALIIAGASIAVIAHGLKYVFRNKELKSIQREVTAIGSLLNQSK
jgi:hypothetical protein